LKSSIRQFAHRADRPLGRRWELTRAKHTSKPLHFNTLLRAFLIAGFCLITATVCPTNAHGQQDDDIGNLAFSIAEAVIETTKTSVSKPTIRVEDFRQTNGSANLLGVALANQVSNQLSQLSKTSVRYFFFVADRPSNGQVSFANQPCDSQHPWPSMLVTADMDEVDGRLVLRVRVIRVSSSQSAFDRRISLPMDSSMKAEFATVLRVEPQPSDVWVNPSYVASEEEESKAAQVDQKAGGYQAPKCVRCGPAQYTDGALAAKIQGTITLRMLVSRDGDPLKLFVVEGLPCGLNQAALRSVANWKLVPAKAPDGKPVEVWQEAEVTFQSY
jgi:TonB family protein